MLRGVSVKGSEDDGVSSAQRANSRQDSEQPSDASAIGVLVLDVPVVEGVGYTGTGWKAMLPYEIGLLVLSVSSTGADKFQRIGWVVAEFEPDIAPRWTRSEEVHHPVTPDCCILNCVAI